jgi:hypothetical protein
MVAGELNESTLQRNTTRMETVRVQLLHRFLPLEMKATTDGDLKTQIDVPTAMNAPPGHVFSVC